MPLISSPRHVHPDRLRRLLFLLAIVLLTACGGGGDERSAAAPSPPATPQVSPLRIEAAVLDLTDRQALSHAEINSLRHLLTAMGIPHVVTEAVETACRYPLVIVANSLAEGSLEAAEADALDAYVSAGGHLAATRLEDAALYPLFGVAAASRTNTRRLIAFEADSQHPALGYLNREEELTISMGDPRYTAFYNTAGYALDSAEALARYEDGSAAVVAHAYGSGSTLLIGAKFSDLIMRALTNHDFEAQRTYSNGFEPSVDAVMLLIKAYYEAVAPLAITTHTVPGSAAGALILTHDLDAQQAFVNALDFMALEQDHGVRATYNVQTKTVSDSLDQAFYTAANIAHLKRVKLGGGDIQSHSVGHFPIDAFEDLPLGDATVAAADYQPSYSDGEVHDGHLYGEIRVSKLRLDADLPGQDTTGFRSGHLAFHRELPAVLLESGYTHSSCRSANDVLTNYPFFLTTANSPSGAPVDVLEIPMTLSDRHLEETNVADIVAAWQAVIAANCENHAVTNLLVHTSRTAYKLEAQAQLLFAVEDLDLWIGDQTRFAAFWRQRLELQYTAERLDWPDSGLVGLRIVLDPAPSALSEPLALVAGAPGDEYDVVEVVDGQGQAVAAEVVESRGCRYVILTP
jgi:hypothetical protein